MIEQLALNLPTRIDYSTESFVEGDANLAARQALARWRDWPRGLLALVGPAGSGKSHLATIWARETGARYIPSGELEETLPELVSGQTLVVEDIDRDLPQPALFHAINRVGEGDIPALLLTARKTPVLWQVSLPDLVSRVRAMPHVDLEEPDDALLTQVMMKQFQDRRAPVKDGVIDYLLPRMERSVAAARMLVEALDKRALVKKTPITRAVAREVLAATSEPDADEGLGEEGEME